MRWFKSGKAADNVARQLYYVCLISQQMQLRRQSSTVRSISRRTLSSTKFSRAVTARESSDIISASKSNTMKLISARDKQKKINNFFDNLTNVFNQSMPRRNHKKQHTAKITLKNKYEQLLLKKSDKAKVLYWNNDSTLVNMTKIVVSADFIFNQDCFWDINSKNNEQKSAQTSKSSQKTHNDSIQQTVVKQWRILHKNNFVIWLIRRRNTWSKLQQLISCFELPIHAIFYIKKKRNYTFDISSIYDQIQRSKAKQPTLINENLVTSRQNQTGKGECQVAFTIFQIVKLNLKDVAAYASYEGRIPVLLGVQVNAVFLRIENQPPGLDQILRYLYKISKGETSNEHDNPLRYRNARYNHLNLHAMSSIRNYLCQYLLKVNKKEIQANIFNVKQEDFYYQQDDITNKIQQMKRKLIDLLIKQQGRNYQFEGGSSIYNFVGEMFKRNYRILSENILAQLEADKRVLKRSQGQWNQNEIMLDLRVNYFEMYLN